MKYVYKHGNQYWYQRTVPKKIFSFLKIKTIKVSLKTNKLFEAIERAQKQAEEHNKMFRYFLSKKRISFIKFSKDNIILKKHEIKFRDDFDDFTKKILKSKTELLNFISDLKTNYGDKIDSTSIDNLLFKKYSLTSTSLITNILDDYFVIKGLNPSHIKYKSIMRSVRYLIDICGEKEFDNYSKSDALKFRDKFISSNQISTGKRNQSNIQNIFSVMYNELNIDKSNPFSMLEWPKSLNKNIRKPFSETELRLFQKECMELCDDLRLIVAMMIDTGCMPSEIIGLRYDDINLDAHLPFLVIRSNIARKVENSSSKRTIPLVGMSLWAAKTTIKLKKKSFLFSKYCSPKKNRIHSAENSINKWIKTNVSDKTSYSFRLSLINRLKKIDCPEEIILQIVGKSIFKSSYFNPREYTLDMKLAWMKQIVLN